MFIEQHIDEVSAFFSNKKSASLSEIVDSTGLDEDEVRGILNYLHGRRKVVFYVGRWHKTP